MLKHIRKRNGEVVDFNSDKIKEAIKKAGEATDAGFSTEELNQLAEAGISAKRYIAEGLGYGSGDEGLMAMTKDLEKGAIGAEAGIQALIEGMKEYAEELQLLVTAAA